MEYFRIAYWVGFASGMLLALLAFRLHSTISNRRATAIFYSGKSTMNLSIKHLL